MDSYGKIEEIVEVVFKIMPVARLFEDSVMKQVKKISEDKLEMMLSEIKEIVNKK